MISWPFACPGLLYVLSVSCLLCVLSLFLLSPSRLVFNDVKTIVSVPDHLPLMFSRSWFLLLFKVVIITNLEQKQKSA